MVYLLLLLYFFGGVWIFYELGKKNSSILNKWVWPTIFILKVALSFGLWALYTFYYPNREQADIFKFFDDAQVIWQNFNAYPIEVTKLLTGFHDTQNKDIINILSNTNNWYKPYNYGAFNDNQTIIRLHLLIRPFSFGYFHIHQVVFSFLSSIGFYWLFFGLIHFLKMPAKAIIICMLVPSVFFWTSGALKETVLFFTFGLLAKGYIITNSNKLFGIFVILISVLLLLIIKQYILLCLACIVVFIYFFKLTKNVFTAVVFTLGLELLMLFCSSYLPLKYNLVKQIEAKQQDFLNLSDTLQSGSAYKTFNLEPTYASIINHLPSALFNVFTQPLLIKNQTLFMLFSSTENIIVLAILLVAIWCLLKIRLQQKEKVILIGFAIFALNLLILIGLTTPVAGALVRYKIPAVFVLMLVSIKIIFKFFTRKTID